MPELRQNPGIGQRPTWPGGNGRSLSLAATGAGGPLLIGVGGEVDLVVVVVEVDVVVEATALLRIVTLTSLL